MLDIRLFCTKCNKELLGHFDHDRWPLTCSIEVEPCSNCHPEEDDSPTEIERKLLTAWLVDNTWDENGNAAGKVDFYFTNSNNKGRCIEGIYCGSKSVGGHFPRIVLTVFDLDAGHPKSIRLDRINSIVYTDTAYAIID